MPILSAFADEISADLREQLAVLKKCGLAHFDLRGAWNVNVMDLTRRGRRVWRPRDLRTALGIVLGQPGEHHFAECKNLEFN
jgi:hypothetical protein